MKRRGAKRPVELKQTFLLLYQNLKTKWSLPCPTEFIFQIKSKNVATKYAAYMLSLCVFSLASHTRLDQKEILFNKLTSRTWYNLYNEK